jgi:hypothetical protein
VTTSPTELTTAATDAILAVVCILGLIALIRLRVLALLALGATTGAFLHAFDWPPPAQLMLRRSLFPILGVAVAMFVVGAIADWRGRDAARAALPWAVAGGAAALILPFVSSLGFRLFVIYEAVGMLSALLIYIWIWKRAPRAGAGTIAGGIALTLLAAGVQASDASLTLGWTFDHNGLFHLIQLLAIVVMARGIRLSLTTSREGHES